MLTDFYNVDCYVLRLLYCAAGCSSTIENSIGTGGRQTISRDIVNSRPLQSFAPPGPVRP
jgi:hypothetical protein